MKKRNVKIKIHGSGRMPFYATPNAAGADIFAADHVIVGAFSRAMVKTGLFLELPDDSEAQIRPRSGLAWKEGITVLNSPGTIDADYRGEVGVILFNSTDEEFKVNYGDRIAQMVFNGDGGLYQAQFEIEEYLSETERGAGGFGHSGK